MVRATSIFLTLITLHRSIAFSIPKSSSSHTATTLYSTPSPIEIDGRSISVQKLDPTTSSSPHATNQIMHLASFRNNLQSPLMTVASQSAKRAEGDPTADALSGLTKGLAVGLLAGTATAISTLDDTGSVRDALTTGGTNFAVIAAAVGGLLAYNGYSGNAVYVSNEGEMINRLTVDYVASVKVGQDVGFAAYATEDAGVSAFPREEDYGSFRGGRYVGTCGMVACVDCQLRNSEVSTAVDPETAGTFETRTVKGLPAHVHLKNMAVDEEVRRKGIARALLRGVEDWARGDGTDAEMMTLEVDEINTAAVKLYESEGFVKDETSRTERIGRFLMKKSL